MALFRIISYVLVASLSILIGIKISSFLQIPLEITLSGLLTVFCGLLILGISTSPSKVILGLIILFGGFAGIYGIIEISLLVNGLISAVFLLLGGLGAYFVIREVTVEREMSTPVFYIAVPVVLALLLFFLRKKPNISLIISMALYFIIDLLAFFQDFGEVFSIGPISFDLRSSLNILGREFTLSNSDRFFPDCHLLNLYFFGWEDCARQD